MTIDELQSQVREAFRGRVCPDDAHVVADDSGYHLECNRVKTIFASKHWSEITREQLVRAPQAIFFLSREAYVYYLPAFILATLAFDPRTDTLRASFVGSLTPQAESSKDFLDRVELLTLQERRAIGEYLKFVTAQVYGSHPVGEEQIALERYWDQFL